jgi:16S rRNA processing protein RimM
VNKSDCFHLGYISRAVGLKGEVVLQIDVDDPLRYKNIDAVFLEIDEALAPFMVMQSRVLKKELTLLLEGIADVDKAREMIGIQAWLPLAALPELDETRFYFHEIPGYKVIDENFGHVGIAEDVIDRPMQPVLRVLAEQTEILLPLAEGAVIKVDRTRKELLVRMPEGLIGLYLDLNSPKSES